MIYISEILKASTWIGDTRQVNVEVKVGQKEDSLKDYKQTDLSPKELLLPKAESRL